LIIPPNTQIGSYQSRFNLIKCNAMVTTALEKIDLNGLIDHTYLKANCTPEDIEVLCQEALSHRFYSICVPPYFVFQARSYLGVNSAVKICTVIGYPMGYNTTAAKVEEIKRAVMDGVDEVDVIANMSAIKAGDWNYVRNDIESVTVMTHLRSRKIKLVFEINELELEEVQKICDICKEKGVDYIKLSTGFLNDTNTLEQVELIRSIISPSIKLKVEGRYKTKMEAKQIVDAGANRIGTTSGIRLISSV